MPNQPNNEYWQGRFEREKEQELYKTNDVIKLIAEDYLIVQAKIRRDIDAWFTRFAENNGISFAEAKKKLTKRELEELRWTIAEYVAYGRENALSQEWMQQLENASAAYHISRLDALEIALIHQSESVHAKLLKRTAESVADQYKDTYYHTFYEIAKGTGVDVSFSGIDENLVNRIVQKPWAADNKDFSARIWNDKDKLNRELHQKLVQMAVTGEAPDEAAKDLAKKFDTSKSNAFRIVQTEHAATCSQARLDSFKELGVEKYLYVATLDNRTSEICREMDGKVFDVEDYKVGETAPPLHPRCRSTTAPYYDDVADLMLRAARNPQTGKTELVDYATYEEWRKQWESRGVKF